MPLRGRLTGSHPGCCAEQSSRIGHSRHRGFCATQIKAPRSINAELCKRPLFPGSSLRATSLRNVRPAALSTGFGQFHNRARTRAIFASITGSAASNAKDAMAAAVYSPTPGRRRKASTQRGTFPFLPPSSLWLPGEDYARGCSIPAPARAPARLFPQPGPEPRGSGILPSNAENRESRPSPSFAAA